MTASIKNCHVYKFCLLFLCVTKGLPLKCVHSFCQNQRELCESIGGRWDHGALKFSSVVRIVSLHCSFAKDCFPQLKAFILMIIMSKMFFLNFPELGHASLVSKFSLGTNALVFSLNSYSSLFCLLAPFQTKKVNIFSASYFILLVYDIIANVSWSDVIWSWRQTVILPFTNKQI